MSIKKALLSVSDKTDIVVLAKKLVAHNIEIISTGGTQKTLEAAGIQVTDISKVTHNPEAFGGRMKTISFAIESALLFDREKDKEEAKKLNIEAIDLVVCNLYPFEKVLKEGADFDTLIENIDIGGPTMIRAAAKNFKSVHVLTKTTDYTEFIARLDAGTLGYDYRKGLMTKAYNHTADYDALIAQTMDKEVGEKSVRLVFTQGKELRYGENSHQQAHFYTQKGVEHTFHGMNILHGKALSYNNVLDVAGAVASVRELDKQACAVVKHSNPCGLAQGDNQRTVLEQAWKGDPISAFGSIIAFNTPLTKETATFFDLTNKDRSKRKFIEVVIAPKIEDDALAYLQNHKNLRVLEYDPKTLPVSPDYRFVNGTLLEQEYDATPYKEIALTTKNSFTPNKELITFGLKAIKNIKSNAIVVVGEKAGNYYIMGMGAGQPNRLIATELAVQKATDFIQAEATANSENFDTYYKQEIAKAYLISDAFFPFADNVELAAGKGVKTIIQPGGSIRDNEIIDVCNNMEVNMIFTGIRHFKH